MKRTPHHQLSPENRRILSGVSRSFDLSIRLLPPALQAPVAIGYLLARATDTVADTTALPIAERQVLLDLLTQAVVTPISNKEQVQELAHLSQGFAAQQTDPNERALMRALPQCLAMLHALTEADQASVRKVLGHITQGQQLDMARFGPGLNALKNDTDLQEYTWLVAGCVGEFWTELCGRHLPGYARLPQEDLVRIGRDYGMGLQRLNIIRDAGNDLLAGRCYWPEETLARAGLTPEGLAELAQIGPNKPLNVQMDKTKVSALHKFTPLYNHCLDLTQAQLANGMRYALALKPLRLRLASALPALIGARTVALLRQAGPVAMTQGIKMPRHEMRALMWRIALGFGTCAVLEKQFKKLSGDPMP